MIWHAFLSSPTKYEIFCKTNWREDMLKLEFPWLLIVGYLIHIDGLESIADHACSIVRSLMMIPV